jgi:phenylacetic acid degradation protein
MANIFSFEGFIPVIHESSFVHPNATVIGNVIIGKYCYVGASAVIRGDWGGIEIADGCNIQENCTVHMFPGVTVRLEEGAHIGHGSVIHGAQIGKNVLIGMNSVIMDNAVIGENSIIGALSFVPADSVIPAGKLAVGSPAKFVRDLTPEMIDWKSDGTKLYQQLPAQCFDSLKPVEPLREVPANRPKQKELYQTWHKSQSKKKAKNAKNNDES